MLDVILELIHHLAVFGIVAVLAAEMAMVAPGLSGRRLDLVGRLDGLYGGLATLVVIVGVSRVIWGDAGWAYYVMNWTFWVKMALFVAVGLLSIPPTMAIVRWRRAAKADASYAVTADAIAPLRRWFLAEAVLLALIPIFAALMARGIGL